MNGNDERMTASTGRAQRTSSTAMQRVGMGGTRWRDLYHWLIRGTWRQLLVTISVVYFGVAFGYALLFMAVPGSIANARAGSLVDAFNFSIQTLSTIGYGTLGPANGYAHFLVATEMLLSLLLTALATGLVFAKFARPTARLLFSEVAVIHREGDRKLLVFRIANERDGRILDASIRVSYVRRESTPGGGSQVSLLDLPLRRAVAPVLALSWSVVHEIDAESPLHGLDEAAMAAEDGSLVVNVNGVDDALSAQIHANHIYATEAIIWNARLVDVLEYDEDGQVRVAYDHFHNHEPEPGPT